MYIAKEREVHTHESFEQQRYAVDQASNTHIPQTTDVLFICRCFFLHLLTYLNTRAMCIFSNNETQILATSLFQPNAFLLKAAISITKKNQRKKNTVQRFNVCGLLFSFWTIKIWLNSLLSVELHQRAKVECKNTVISQKKLVKEKWLGEVKKGQCSMPYLSQAKAESLFSA